MPLNQYDVSVINTAIGALPSIIALIKESFHSSNPTNPLPTDSQVIAAMLSAAASTIAIDEAWKAAHSTNKM